MNNILKTNIFKLFRNTSFKFYSTQNYIIPQTMNFINTNLNIHIKENPVNPSIPIFNNDLNSNDSSNTSIELKGRNSHHPKRANHGARPCCSVMRKLKKRAYHRKPKVKY